MPSHLVRLLRPDDLVVLEIAGFDVQLAQDDGGPALVPTAADAFLVVTFSFQHMGELAFSTADGETPFVPVPVLVAEPSRLAYSVPAGERIEYSTAGILAALSRLPLRVVPLAAPRPVGLLSGRCPPCTACRAGSPSQRATRVSSSPTARRSTCTVSVPPPVDALLAHASSLRTARRLLAPEGALDLTGLTGGPTVGRQKALQPPAAITRTGIGDDRHATDPVPRARCASGRGRRVSTRPPSRHPWRLLDLAERARRLQPLPDPARRRDRRRPRRALAQPARHPCRRRRTARSPLTS